MEHPEEHYYKLNRFFLSVSGLCPYQSKRNAYLIRIACTVIVLSSVFVQVFTEENTVENSFLFNSMLDIFRPEN